MSICVYLRGDKPAPLGCDQRALPGSDYCEVHLDDAVCCVVEGCVFDTTTEQHWLCSGHQQRFIADGSPPVRLWLSQLT